MKRSAAVLLLSILVSFLVSDALAAKSYKTSLDVELCTPSKIKVDDGDTFKCNGEIIRILGIDTPEISHPKHGIAIDQEMGPEAAAFTKAAIGSAKRVVIIRSGKDRYKRTLANVLIDGELLAVKLIKAGLAYETITRYGDNAQPEFALAVLEAAKEMPTPTSQDPNDWRKENQKK